MSTHPPQLELIEGGLTSDDVAWDRFCERIGWQQNGEATLPDDYEDRLVERLFETPERNVVSIVGEPLAADEPAWFSDGRSPWRTLGAALAVAAMVAVAVVALSRVVGGAPPAARTIPTPAPERAPEAPVAPAPEGELPRLVHVTTPEPERVMEPETTSVVRTPPGPVEKASRHARLDAVRPVAPERMAEAPSLATAPSASPDRVATISPEPETVSSSLVSAALPVHLSLPVAHPSTESHPLTLGRAPSPPWRHLAMAPELGADHRAVALVDLVEAGRSLQGAL